MGNVLEKGWDTTVNDLKDKEVDGDFTLKFLKRVTQEYAKNTDSNGDITVYAVFTKRSTSSLLSTLKCTCTKKPFHDFIKKVCEAVVTFGKSLGSHEVKLLRQAINEVANSFAKSASNPVIKRLFREIAESSVQSSTGSVNQLVKGTAGAVVEETVENLSKLRQARSSAKSALKWGVVVEGACLAYTIYDTHTKLQKGEITPQQRTRTIVTRSSRAAGSLGGGALGSFVGTLVLPGVGSFFGGFVGGMAGDYLGAWMGEKAYENS